ncbi:hypothetical protein [Lentzea sp. CA-135723]|uniref:hypothetical protein n=1 Tax=Lentzea sp. CA-135723 TaxID=3239950 RepID=UPI003D8B54B2
MDAEKQVAWVCAMCRAVITPTTCGDVGCERHRDSEVLCGTCRLRPDWEALPRAVRDEVGAMAETTSPIRAGYLLMGLDGHRRRPLEYMMITSYGYRASRRSCSCPETDYGHVRWTCPSCDRPLLGCDHDRGETCGPCLSAPAWDALPQAWQDEIAWMVGAGDLTSAAHRLRDLDENRLDAFDYVLMTVHVQGR